MSQKRFTVEQMQTMAKRYGSDQNIADAFGVSQQTIQRQRKTLGVCHPSGLLLEIRNKNIKRLKAVGWLVRELAEKFNLSERHIKRITMVL